LSIIDITIKERENMKNEVFEEAVDNLDLLDAIDLLRNNVISDDIIRRSLDIQQYDEQKTVKGLKKNRIIAMKILDRIDFALSLIKGTEQYLNY
jgi:hypothetical protein